MSDPYYEKLPECVYSDDPLGFITDDRFSSGIFENYEEWIIALGESECKISECKPTLMKKEDPPVFDVEEYLCDYMGDEGELKAERKDITAFNAMVNKWISEQAPICYMPRARMKMHVKTIQQDIAKALDIDPEDVQI